MISAKHLPTTWCPNQSNLHRQRPLQLARKRHQLAHRHKTSHRCQRMRPRVRREPKKRQFQLPQLLQQPPSSRWLMFIEFGGANALSVRFTLHMCQALQLLPVNCLVSRLRIHVPVSTVYQTGGLELCVSILPLPAVRPQSAKRQV